MGALEKEQLSPFGWDLINDLSALPDNENIIIEYLLRRIEHNQIYTWVGPLLLALNPGKSSPLDFYDKKYGEYKNASDVARKEVSPHICTVAARAHYRLVQNLGKSCQVIVISGESGTGKTFNANKALNFLAAINEISSVTGHTRVHDIVRKITSACPLISAFSTATTERNIRSSRHGQLVRLEYDNENICGATIHSFLLERSRVTMGSDNFHIFYQLIEGLSDYELQTLRLYRNGHYCILGDNQRLQNSDLCLNFEKTINAMDDLGFSTNERNDIFQIIAVLIHFGNIKFKERVCGGCAIDTNDQESKEALYNACILTKLSATELTKLFTTARISSNNTKRGCSVSHCELGTVEICRNRLHSIIRHIYYQLFQQLIDRVNKSLSSRVKRNNWLGILDIFGFEVFTENGIEQLCINYANERLQLYFMEDYLDCGKYDLIEEGFNNFPESEQTHVYKDRLAVIESSLFPTLSDATQCSAQFNVTILRNRLLDKSTIKFLTLPSEKPTFIIQHYSSPVEYSFQNFVSKNSDKVPPELPMIFATSKNVFLRSLKENVKDDTTDSNGKIYVKKSTTLAKLKQNLDALIKELNKCDSHYVRCVRPSRMNGLWMKDEFKKQLACTGVFDALPLARCKYPIRMIYQDFVDRYSLKHTDIQDSKLLCNSIIEQTLKSKTSESVYFGNRLIFLSESTFFDLECFRKKCFQSARKIQTFWKNKRKNINLNREKNVIPKNDYETNKILHKYLINSHLEEKIVLSQTAFKINDPFLLKDENETCKSLNNLPISNNIKENILKKKSPKLKLNINSKISFKTIFGNFYCNDKLELLSKSEMTNCVQPNTFVKINKDSKTAILSKRSLGDIEQSRVVIFDGCVFHYKNRIISRQKLAKVPVRFHTRLTCLQDSHRLPRSELPRGLQDCL